MTDDNEERQRQANNIALADRFCRLAEEGQLGQLTAHDTASVIFLMGSHLGYSIRAHELARTTVQQRRAIREAAALLAERHNPSEDGDPVAQWLALPLVVEILKDE